MKRLLMIMLILMPLVGISDQIYRYTDEKGIVHFSDKPINEGQDHELIPLPDAPTPTPMQGKAKSESAESSTTEEKTEKTAENNQPTQEEIEYCKTLAVNMNTLENTPRVRIKKANGEFEILGEESKKAEIERLKMLMKEFC